MRSTAELREGSCLTAHTQKTSEPSSPPIAQIMVLNYTATNKKRSQPTPVPKPQKNLHSQENQAGGLGKKRANPRRTYKENETIGRRLDTKRLRLHPSHNWRLEVDVKNAEHVQGVQRHSQYHEHDLSRLPPLHRPPPDRSSRTHQHPTTPETLKPPPSTTQLKCHSTPPSPPQSGNPEDPTSQANHHLRPASPDRGVPQPPRPDRAKPAGRVQLNGHRFGRNHSAAARDAWRGESSASARWMRCAKRGVRQG